MNRVLYCISGIAIFLFISITLWLNLPTHITNISPSEVSKIDIRDGSNGKTTSIESRPEIEHIIDNLNNVSLKKDRLSIGYVGWSFNLKIYKGNGKLYKEFVINSDEYVRKDPFFYKDSSKSIDYEYIKKLVR